jgi:hypothetical protein
MSQPDKERKVCVKAVPKNPQIRLMHLVAKGITLLAPGEFPRVFSDHPRYKLVHYTSLGGDVSNPDQGEIVATTCVLPVLPGCTCFKHLDNTVPIISSIIFVVHSMYYNEHIHGQGGISIVGSEFLAELPSPLSAEETLASNVVVEALHEWHDGKLWRLPPVNAIKRVYTGDKDYNIELPVTLANRASMSGTMDSFEALSN